MAQILSHDAKGFTPSAIMVSIGSDNFRINCDICNICAPNFVCSYLEQCEPSINEHVVMKNFIGQEIAIFGIITSP